VARRLSHKRALDGLDPARRKKVERLLGQVQALLDGE
jgi:ParB family chromosome partitioning protein